MKKQSRQLEYYYRHKERILKKKKIKTFLERFAKTLEKYEQMDKKYEKQLSKQLEAD